MGCLKNLISIVILIFAIIGFNSVGGIDFVKKKIKEYRGASSGQLIENVKIKGDYTLGVEGEKG